MKRKRWIFLGPGPTIIQACKVDLFRDAMCAMPAVSDPLRKVEPNGTLTASLLPNRLKCFTKSSV